jgi:hypothetical protein
MISGTKLLPPAPIYNNRLQDGLKAVKGHLGSLASAMRRFGIDTRSTRQACTLCISVLEKMSRFQYPVTRTCGLYWRLWSWYGNFVGILIFGFRL